MAKIKLPSTQALRFLKSKSISFKPYFYKYVERGGTQESAKQLNIEERKIVKTLIFEDDNNKPFIVLMNGDYETSTKKLAREIKSKTVSIANPQKAEKYTGYRVGGTSPFGSKTDMKVFIQKDILLFDTVLINGGKRGFLIEISVKDLTNLLNTQALDIGRKK